MNTRMAMVACQGSAEGPWVRPRGCETGIRVSCLGVGAQVFVDYELRGSSELTTMQLAEGRHPFHHSDCRRFRFRKVANGDKLMPTTVEIEFK